MVSSADRIESISRMVSTEAITDSLHQCTKICKTIFTDCLPQLCPAPRISRGRLRQTQAARRRRQEYLQCPGSLPFALTCIRRSCVFSHTVPTPDAHQPRNTARFSGSYHLLHCPAKRLRQPDQAQPEDRLQLKV